MGGQTTWASGSDVYDADKMSEDNNDTLSLGGLSDDANASLVGFGEGANSVVDAPISNAPIGLVGRLAAQQQQYQQLQQQQQQQQHNAIPKSKGEGDSMQGVTLEQQRIRNSDAPPAYDREVSDPAVRNPLPPAPGSAQGTPAPRHAGLSGRETTERIVQERYASGDRDFDMGGH